MKRKIKISENELYKIIQKVIKEQELTPTIQEPSKEKLRRQVQSETERAQNQVDGLLRGKTFNMTPYVGDQTFDKKTYPVTISKIVIPTPTVKIKKGKKQIYGPVYIKLVPNPEIKNKNQFEITAFIDSENKYVDSLVSPYFQYTDIGISQDLGEKGLKNEELADTIEKIVRSSFFN